MREQNTHTHTQTHSHPQPHTHTPHKNTHTHTYIYIYIYRSCIYPERWRRGFVFSGLWGRVSAEASWNVMAHAQKPDFVFQRNGRVHLNRQEASVQSTTGSQGLRISSSNAGYTTFRSSVKSTVYHLHSPVSPSLPIPCATVCHHISTGVYNRFATFRRNIWNENPSFSDKSSRTLDPWKIGRLVLSKRRELIPLLLNVKTQETWIP
jgi:hypothetical protein